MYINKSQRTVAFLGIALIALSIAAIPIWLFPLPIKATPGINSFASEVASAPEFIKVQADIGGMHEDEISLRLLWALRIIWLKNLAFIGTGILLGVLLMKRFKWGRYLALGFFGWLIALRIKLILSHGLSHYILVHSIIFERTPMLTVLEHLDVSLAIIGFAILITPFGRAAFVSSTL